jgi:Domain of unknown function (DUF4157)
MQAPLQARNDSDAAQTDTAKTVAQKRVLADYRPEAVAQRQLAEMMNNSPRVLQQRALSNAIHNSPRMVAQRHEMNGLLGGTAEPRGDGAMPAEASPAQRKEKTNNTGLPNQLKSGIESLSGMSMDHIKVHYNSDKPAQLQAHAYAQGSEIHLAPRQEAHLPHEAWHVVQQAQGRVRATLQMKTGAVNDDLSLEKEADMMGEKALQFKGDDVALNLVSQQRAAGVVSQHVAGFGAPVQRAVLMSDGDTNSLIPTLKKLMNELILADTTEDERRKIAELLGKDSVIKALEVLRETDTGFNFSAVLAAFRARCGGPISDQVANVLANALSRDTLMQAGLSADENVELKENLRLSPYITTDDDRTLARRQSEDESAIKNLKLLFPEYAAVFQHIFKGDFSVGSAKLPTGYHAQNGGSTTHETYGTITPLLHNTYQQSVQTIHAVGGKKTKKTNQSTFFPLTASEEDIKVAVVSGDKRHNKEVQYPRSLQGLPLKKTGGTIYPDTGADRLAE